jgi:hypothetical protein
VTASARVEWRKGTASAGGNCVEVAFTEGSVHVRNSNAPSGPVMSFSPSKWVTFLAGVREGKFDRAVFEDVRTEAY